MIVPLALPQKAWRVAVVLLASVLFLGGTLVGDDDWWPFSPWRMFSTSTDPNGAVRSTFIEVRTAAEPATWVEAPISPDSVGLNRAEIEGNLDRIAKDLEADGVRVEHPDEMPAALEQGFNSKTIFIVDAICDYRAPHYSMK